MTPPEFQSLVSRLETYASRAPRSYQLRVALLACLGYAFLCFAVAALLAVIAGIAAAVFFTKDALLLVKLVIGPTVLVSIILRSMRVSVPDPQGIPIKRVDAPRLFSLLDETQAELKAPPFHGVLLTQDFNAAVAQVPRFGILGRHRSFLMLGLPLMQALTPEQFKAVVAHEVGHLSGNHARFSGWIHRIRLIWIQVVENLHLEKRRRAAAWFQKFFEWYAPYFSAYSFVLARQNEYEADLCAAKIAGNAAMVQALIAVEVRQRFWRERFWPDVEKQVEQNPQPPPIFATFSAALQHRLLPEDAQIFFSYALGEKTGTADTHPSLTDRLHALGYQTDSQQICQQMLSSAGLDTAAANYLDQSLPRLSVQIEQKWQKQVSPDWERRYQYVQQCRESLTALDQKVKDETLTKEECWNRAYWTMEFGEPEAAITLFARIAAEFPSDAEAQIALGRLKLQQCDVTGLVHLEAAIDIEPGVTLDASRIAYNFCKRQGLDAEADKFQQQAAARRQVLQKARAERELVESNAHFEDNGLSPEALADLVEQIKGFREIKAAYLVKKKVRYLPEHPLYVLWLVPHFITHTSHQNLVKRIAPQIKFSSQMHCFVTDGSDLRVLKIRRQFGKAQIYRKGH